MSSRSDEQRGSVSAFVVCIAAGLVYLGLMLHDNGRVMAEYVRITDVAGNAARLGAQSIVGIRAGDPHVDTRAAVARARKFLSDSDVDAKVSVSQGSVTVEAHSSVEAVALRVLGIGRRHVHTVQTARLVSG